MISFSNINKQYGKQLLFVDASFQLNPGEKVGLVGPNGAGYCSRWFTGDQSEVLFNFDQILDSPNGTLVASNEVESIGGVLCLDLQNIGFWWWMTKSASGCYTRSCCKKRDTKSLLPKTAL